MTLDAQTTGPFLRGGWSCLWMGLAYRPVHSPSKFLWLHSPQTGLGPGETLVPFLRNGCEFPAEGGPVGHCQLSAVSIYLVPGMAAPRAGPWLRLPLGGSPREAAAQPSVMPNNSRMRGLAKGCMSWMRSSLWVCWALMLRSSVSMAMIFRNRNRWAGWGRLHSM